MNFVRLGDKCCCCELGRPQPSCFPGDSVCRFGKEWQISPGIFQRLLQWENRTGNAPPVGSFLQRAFSYRVVPVSSGKKRPSPCPWPCGVSEALGRGQLPPERSGAERTGCCPPPSSRAPPAGWGGPGRYPRRLEGARLNKTRKITSIQKKKN